MSERPSVTRRATRNIIPLLQDVKENQPNYLVKDEGPYMIIGNRDDGSRCVMFSARSEEEARTRIAELQSGGIEGYKGFEVEECIWESNGVLKPKFDGMSNGTRTRHKKGSSNGQANAAVGADHEHRAVEAPAADHVRVVHQRGSGGRGKRMGAR